MTRHQLSLYFVRYDLHNILNTAIQCGADFHENLRGDMTVPAHLGDGRRADASLCTQVFLLHILVDEQFPELFITDRHKISPPYRYTKNALPDGRALGLYSHTAEAYYNTDSVVYKYSRIMADLQ